MAKALRGRRQRRAGTPGRRHRQRHLLQARPLFRRRAVAARARRRPDPDQHDPRGAQPAHVVRRDRRRAGHRLAARRAASRSRTRCPSTCALPVARWAASCCPTPPPARAAGSRPRRRTRPTRATTTRTATVVSGTNGSLAIPTMRLKTYARPEDRSWWKPFETGVVGMVRDDPLQAPAGALLRARARRGRTRWSARATAWPTCASPKPSPRPLPAARPSTSLTEHQPPKEHDHEHPRAARHQPQHVRQARPGAVRHRHAGRNRPAACRRWARNSAPRSNASRPTSKARCASASTRPTPTRSTRC